jgi:hypothetical protein
MTYVKKTEFAKQVGLHWTTISKYIKNGKLAGCLKGDLIHLEKGKAAIVANVAPIQQKNINVRWEKKKEFTGEEIERVKRAGLNKNTSLAEAQRIKTVCDAALKQIELQRQKGEVVDLAEVKKQATECAMLAKSQLLSLPDRLSAILATIDDPAEVKKTLKSEINNICEAISAGKWVDSEAI